MFLHEYHKYQIVNGITDDDIYQDIVRKNDKPDLECEKSDKCDQLPKGWLNFDFPTEYSKTIGCKKLHFLVIHYCFIIIDQEGLIITVKCGNG